MSQKTKLTIEDVQKFISDNDCELLTTEYVNMKQKLDIRCECGNIFNTNLDTFKNKNKRSCNSCSKNIASVKNTNSIEKVTNYIKGKGCELISEYTNAKEKLIIKCSCGDIFERNFNKFKSGQTRCKTCVGRSEWNIDTISEYIRVKSNSGCALLSKFYKDRYQKIDILCVCGSVYQTTFFSFLNDNKRTCDECTKNRFREIKRTGISNLKLLVRENSDSELISDEYENYHQKLKFECKCGNRFETSITSFNNGKVSCDICSPNSKLEYVAEKYFIENKVNYISQYKFDDLLSPKNRKLMFDFAILDDNNKLIFLLELDGEQHFKPSFNFGGQDKFEQTLLYDSIKNKYCEENSLNLIRVSYKELKNLENVLSKILIKHGNPVPSL